MNRQEKTDAEQLFMAALEENQERIAKVSMRLGTQNLIEIAARCYRLFENIQSSMPPEDVKAIQKRLDELNGKKGTASGQSSIN